MIVMTVTEVAAPAVEPQIADRTTVLDAQTLAPSPLKGERKKKEERGEGVPPPRKHHA
jgi:hypothetical protein